MELRKFLLGALALVLLLLPHKAGAWSEAGHKIIASLAFRQLTPAAQARLIAILKHHPRFAEDFTHYMPADVAAGAPAAQHEWLLQQASIWPDMARGLPDELKRVYNHATWHYIDIPSFLSEADRTALASTLSINTSLDPPAAPAEDLNAIQLIRLARKSLADDATDPAQAALMLCWLMHVVGDIHQPLHSTAMFAEHLFPEGDKGGNSISTQQGFNLHALWDEFLGDWATGAIAQQRSSELLADAELAKLGAAAAAALDEPRWLDESRQLAESTVYAPEVLSYLRVIKPRSENYTPPPLRLSEEYLTTGVRVSTARVVQAGYRLGAVLQEFTAK